MRSTAVLAFCVVLAVASPGAASARTPSRGDLRREREALEREKASPWADDSSALPTEVAVAGTASVLYLAVGDEDEEVSAHIQSEQSTVDRATVRFGKSLGEVPLNFGVLSSLGLYGWTQSDRRARGCALDGFAAAAVGEGVIVPALKILLGRRRPNAGVGSHSYDLVDGGQSFPSGHTALAFSLAGTLHAWYPDWRGWTAVGLAATTGFSRVHSLAHWPSDVVAGALIGYGTARWVARSRLRQHLPDMFPVFTKDYTGASIGTRF